jgi:hypothetical protein
MSTTEVTAIVGAVTGVSGFLLGVLNYLHQRGTSRPRIVVRPRIYNFGDPRTGETTERNAAVMEICNVGHVPVIGSTIGFVPKLGIIGTLVAFLLERKVIGGTIRLVLRRKMLHAISQFVNTGLQSKGTIFLTPKPIGGLDWTNELKPQGVAMLQFSLEGLPEERKLGRAFARTTVGDTFTAGMSDMRIFAEQREATSH